MALRDLIKLPSGRVVAVQMPDLPAILLTVGRVPNQVLVDLLNLLVKDGLWSPKGPDENRFLDKRTEVLGWYAAASLLLHEPRLVLAPAQPDPDKGEIGASDLTFEDLEVLYATFRYWHPRPFDRSWADAAQDNGGAADHVPPGAGLPPAAGEPDGRDGPDRRVGDRRAGTRRRNAPAQAEG